MRNPLVPGCRRAPAAGAVARARRRWSGCAPSGRPGSQALRLERIENIRPLSATTVVPQNPSCRGMPHHCVRNGVLRVVSSETWVLSEPWLRWVQGSEPAGKSVLRMAHTPESSARTFASGSLWSIALRASCERPAPAVFARPTRAAPRRGASTRSHSRPQLRRQVGVAQVADQQQVDQAIGKGQRCCHSFPRRANGPGSLRFPPQSGCVPRFGHSTMRGGRPTWGVLPTRRPATGHLLRRAGRSTIHRQSPSSVPGRRQSSPKAFRLSPAAPNSSIPIRFIVAPP